MHFSRQEAFLFGLCLGLVIAIPLSWIAHALAWLLIWGIGVTFVLYLVVKWFSGKFRLP
jgi:hypothetical protein